MPPPDPGIAAGPLEGALTAFARASGVLLACQPDLVRGLSSPGVQGCFTSTQALAMLLAGTGLQAVVAENGAWTLRRATEPAAAARPAAAAGAAATGLPLTLRQDAYWLFDLNFTLNVDNAFDKKYFAGVTNFTSQGLFYTWGVPRSVDLGARYGS